MRTAANSPGGGPWAPPVRLSLWQQRRWSEIECELAKIVESLRRLAAEKVILFGSHARGDFNEFSDIDLVVIMQAEGRMVDRIGTVLDVIDSKFAVEPLVYTLEEYNQLLTAHHPLVENIDSEGLVLYERKA